MKFNIISKPNQKLTKEADGGDSLWDDEEIDIYEHFNTDQTDDFIAGYFRKADYSTGVFTIVGELSKDEIKDAIDNEGYLEGGIPDFEEVKFRLEVFVDTWDELEWEVFEFCGDEGEKYSH